MNKHSKYTNLSKFAIAAALFACIPAYHASAVITWTGASSTLWATGTNWSNGIGPATTDTVSFTDTGASTLPGDVTSILDANRTIAGLSFSDAAAKYQTLDLAADTLTVTGILSFNLDKSTSTITTIRDGNLTVNSPFANVYVGSAISSSATGNANLLGLTALNVTAQSVQIGTSTAGSANGTLTLASTTNITTPLLQVGASSSTGDSTGTLHLESNATILATEFDVGKNNATGTVDAASGATINLGSTAQPTNLLIGIGNLSTNNTYGGTMNLAGAAVNANLNQFIVGQKNGGSGLGDPGQQSGTFLGGSSGSITIGTAANPGLWYVGYTINGGDSLGIVDVSGMAALQAYVSNFFVGNSAGGGATGTVSLAANNTITATGSILVGSGAGGGSGTLTLGLSNTILTNQLTIGQGFSNGTVTAPAGATVNLGAATSLPVNLSVGITTLGSNNNYTGRLDLTGANVTAHLGQFIVGQKDGGSGPGDPGEETGVVIGGNSGSITIGSLATPTAWYVGYTINGGIAQGNVDFSHMNSLQATLTDFIIGKAMSGSISGTVLLPLTNSINASNSIVVGSGVGGGSSSLTLGVNNTLLTSQFTIGQGFSNGTVTTPAAATVVLGSAAAPTNLSVGITTLGSNDGYTGRLDLTGANVTAYLGQFIVGQKDGGSGPGDPGEETGVVTGGNSGSITIGSPTARTAWYVGYTINGGIAQGNVDFSHMNSLQAYLTDFIIGKAMSGSASGTVLLPTTNSIDASNSIVVGSGVGGGSSTLTLGQTNTFLTNQLTIGQGYSSGQVILPAGGTLTLGSLSQPTNVSIGLGNTNTVTPTNSTLNLSNGTVIAILGNVDIGDGTLGGGSNLATLSLSSNPNNYIDAASIALGGPQAIGTLNFAGGTLFAGSITKGTGTATFNWTGGQLSVGSFGTSAINFNLQNTGTGTLAPGSDSGAIGTTTIFGNYTQGTAASMDIRIAGTGNDLVAITGTAALSGTLNLSVLNGFTPTVGQNFLIATYASHTGTFAFVAPPSLPQNVAFQLDYTSSPTQLLIHMVAPTTQNWISTAANANFSTPANWDTLTAPGTTSSLSIATTGSSPKTITVSNSTTVQSISLQGTASAPVTLEVLQGIQLGVSYQLLVGSNATLSGGGQIFGNVVINKGALAPSFALPATSTNTLTMNTLTTNNNTTLSLNLLSPGTNDALNITSLNGLTLNGGQIQIANAPNTASSLGFYKIIQYTGTLQGTGLASLTAPATANNIAYYLDTTHDPGYIDLHRGFLGDVDDSGFVDINDLAILASNWQQPGTWSQGNFLNDPTVDINDLAVLAANWQTGITSFGEAADSLTGTSTSFQQAVAGIVFGGTSSVPEPTSLALLGLGAASLLTRRRNRR